MMDDRLLACGSMRSLADPPVRRRLFLAAAVALASVATGGCGGSTPGPHDVLSRYLSAWSARHWTAMSALVDRPPDNFVATHERSWASLGVTNAVFVPGPLHRTGSHTARARVTEHLTLGRLGTWDPTTTVALVQRQGTWRVRWSPATINPRIPAGGRLAAERIWPDRAPILGVQDAPLTTDARGVTVGVVGQRVRVPGQVQADLVAAGASRTAAQAALITARAHPAQFVPVFTVSRARFAQLKTAPGPGNVYAVAGTSFVPAHRRQAITTQLAAHLVGTVGPITADELHRLGAPYDASSTVGQSGLEAQYERQLAGTPRTEIVAASADGAPTAILTTFPGRRGRPVRTSLEPYVQRAAERALSRQPRAAAMIAMRVSTGQVLADVSDPVSAPFDQALNGAYAPGSTFKVLISAALLDRGLVPSSPASCPPTLNVDGEPFHNADGDGPAQTIDASFTESCNTAFIALTLGHLTPHDLAAVGAQFGLDRTPHIGVPAFDANVIAPRGRTALAAAAIGQDRLTFSPLGMATVAAAVGHGSALAPRLVDGAPDDRVAPLPLPAATVSGLRTMMAHVVTHGTAAETGLPPATFAKTGTAQYTQDGQLRTDAWLMGWHGDIAFAVVVQDSGQVDGGPRDGPIVARFFDGLNTSLGT